MSRELSTVKAADWADAAPTPEGSTIAWLTAFAPWFLLFPFPPLVRPSYCQAHAPKGTLGHALAEGNIESLR